MLKKAQKRSLLNVLKEKTPILNGKSLSKYFDPEYKEIMNDLYKKDSDIRSTVMGKSYNKGEVKGIPEHMKSFLKSAKSNLNRREYIGATSDLGKFHFNASEVNKLCTGLNLKIDEIHQKFLFKGLKGDHIDQLKSLHTRWAAQQNDIIKQAGFTEIKDFFVNHGTSRGRALAAWEARYPKMVGDLRDKTSKMLDMSQSFYDELLAHLEEMGSARAESKIDDYLGLITKISRNFAKYDAAFKMYYNETVKPYVDKAKLFEQQAPVENPKELGNKEVAQPAPASPPPVSQNLLVSPSAPSYLSAPPPAVSYSPAKPSSTNFDTEELAPNTVKDPSPLGLKHEEVPPSKAAYRNFINSLEAMSSESPRILAAYINKYAQSIKNDKETYNKLLNIVASIKE
jgi:hypothetical protein